MSDPVVPLFREYPRLQQKLAHVPLGIFPTPVERLCAIERVAGHDGIYIKRDDLSGQPYGGNKVRKLEFLLAEAQRRGAREVMTIGFAGSNHALATAIHAKRLGLTSTSLLLPQVNANYVRRNLLASHSVGARLRYYRYPLALGGGLAMTMLSGWMKHRVFPAYIPAGGSCPIGVAGYVNAALELRDQIRAGQLPTPDRIYVPLGSMGTCIGLCLGLQAAGLKTQVIAVRVIEERLVSPRKLKRLFEQSSRFLHQHDPAFPLIPFSPDSLVIRNGFMGERYAAFTQEGVAAAKLFEQTAGVPLNGAYSAKAAAALLADAQSGELAGKTVLFWNTYNSRDLTSFVYSADYRQLPRSLHRYFEEDVQVLDRPAMRY